MTISKKLTDKETKLAVVGLGYVGLPLAVGLSEHFNVIGYDRNEKKIAEYINGHDLTGDIGSERLLQASVQFTADEKLLAEASFYIVSVPTPIRDGKVPDLKFVKSASATIGSYLKKGDYVVYESTVYPGVTEEICQPILEQNSGLRAGVDFKIGYSPERINPGDREHTLENIVKIVSGIDNEALEQISHVYSKVVKAGVYHAPSIRVAEAAKVIENAQRDVNIAFMNELAMIFSQMKLETNEVLKAAATKWNFLPFTPGLVGGHCIGIDPYYLTFKAEDEGYHSKIILNSRHVNEGMASFVANQMVKQLMRAKQSGGPSKVALLGLTYKENSNDVRNSKVIDLFRELVDYGIQPMIYDPVANAEEVREEYGVEVCQLEDIKDVSLVAIVVPHKHLLGLSLQQYAAMYDKNVQQKLFFDLKGTFNRTQVEENGLVYWSL